VLEAPQVTFPELAVEMVHLVSVWMFEVNRGGKYRISLRID